MVDLEVAEVEGSREAMGVVEEERVEVSREPETGSVQTRESEFGVSTHHLLNEDRKTFLLLLYKIMVLKVLSFFHLWLVMTFHWLLSGCIFAKLYHIL